MNKITKHPLYAACDKLKKAFAVCGFSLEDDGYSPEVVTFQQDFDAFEPTEEYRCSRIELNADGYVFRSGLLAGNLPKFDKALPVKGMVCGNVYDSSSENHPARLRLEGVWADKEVSFKDVTRLFNNVVKEVLGLGAKARLEASSNGSYNVFAENEDGKSFLIGCVGKALWLAKVVLNISEGDCWVFSADADNAALAMFGFNSREELYNNNIKFLSSLENAEPSFGGSFLNQAADVLRAMGYSRYIGSRIYKADCYKKMNMFQDEWDANNKGILLKEPLGNKVWLPTVLTPAGEEALETNWHDGAKEVRIFDIEHIYLPGKNGAAPIEKTALSIKAYAPDMDSRKFRAEIDEFFAKLGIKNHFAFPTNMAIAYDQTDTWLLMDEKMRYLEGNYGGISPIALKNHGIETKAFMANFELAPLEEKAAEEYSFTPPELL